MVTDAMTYSRPVLPSCAVLYALVALGLPLGKYAAGSYLRDVELIGPSSLQLEHNTVYYYPSYVKGKDPVEEYNARRLHVDTGNFMEQEDDQLAEGEKTLHRSQQQQKASVADADCCSKAKRKRKYTRGRAHQSKQRAPDPMRVVDAQTDHEYNYLKIRKAAAGVPRYVRDDVELFDIVRPEKRMKEKRPIRRRTRTVVGDGGNGERRYEESDPQVFAYERSDVEPIERGVSNQPGKQEDSQYFQYAEVFGDGSFTAGARRGNDQHYVEQLERGSHGIGVFQKKVKWADKSGGFGEHYWDLNHIQPSGVSHR
ncbi:AGAP006262-PA [Anopheles gambiae str. PEST]|uniref:AGAP006262-PA n=2 Tax=Anopheles gambiae TaxID=7165 RepID=A7UU67_ANOGA|nr:AGAP006262-PA [Anopheles gambiae str. PEST]